jgi:hypothetical protein
VIPVRCAIPHDWAWASIVSAIRNAIASAKQLLVIVISALPSWHIDARLAAGIDHAPRLPIVRRERRRFDDREAFLAQVLDERVGGG